MTRTSELTASGVALAMLAVWWVFTYYIDGAVLRRFPYHRYETIALLYPDIYYPALPGWIAAHAQPFSWGVWVVTVGWMLVLSAIIGVGAAKYASGRDVSSSATAAAFVVVSFVVVTVLEAVATLLA